MIVNKDAQYFAKAVNRNSPIACIRSANMRLRNRSELVASDGLPSCRSFLRRMFTALLSRLYYRGLLENDGHNDKLEIYLPRHSIG